MIKEIVKDIDILTQKSEKFDLKKDAHIIQDMIDTAKAHENECVGLAAVQIGEHKRVILVKIEEHYIPFINPFIIKCSPQTYDTREGCLSLEGSRPTKRHYTVDVMYTDRGGKVKRASYNGFTAQIIQHEIDHLNGVLI